MSQRVLSKTDAETVTRRSLLKDGSLCFRTRKFTQVVTRLAPGCVLVTGIGYNDGRCAPLVTAELARALPEVGQLAAFVNLSAQTGQASVAREWWGEWVKQQRPRLATTHMLVRSRLMDMAISVLGMIVGGDMIQAHSSAQTFERAISASVPKFSALPAYPDLPPLLE